MISVVTAVVKQSSCRTAFAANPYIRLSNSEDADVMPKRHQTCNEAADLRRKKWRAVKDWFVRPLKAIGIIAKDDHDF
jgi:hypothetical protein